MSTKVWALPPAANEIAALNSNHYLYRTQNFQSVSPTWSSIDLLPTGYGDESRIDAFVLDPLSPGLVSDGPINGWFTTCGTQVWINNPTQITSVNQIQSEVPGQLYRIEDIFGTPVVTQQLAFAYACLTTSRPPNGLPGARGRSLKVNAQGYVICISHYALHGTYWVRWDPESETWNSEAYINLNVETSPNYDHRSGLWISNDPTTQVKARCTAYNPGGYSTSAQGKLYELLDWNGAWSQATYPNIDLSGGLGDDFAVSPHDDACIMYYNKKVLYPDGYSQDNHLYRSNGSASPQEVAHAIGRPWPGGISFSYKNAQHIVFGSAHTGDLKRSVNGGTGWNSIAASSGYSFPCIASDGKTLYACGRSAQIGLCADFTQLAMQDRRGNLQSLAPISGGSYEGHDFVGLVGLPMARVDEPPHDGECTCPWCHASNDGTRTGNPISLRKGEKRFEATDLALNTPVGVMGFTRKYRQSKQPDVHFQFMGLGWTHNHKIKLTVSGTSPYRQAEVVMTNGGILKLREDSGTPAHFDALTGSNSTLDYASDQFTLVAPDGSAYVFGHELAGSTGSLYRVESRTWTNGEAWTYSYASDIVGTSASHQLVAIDDGYGRGLQFAYVDDVGQFDDAQLWRVGDQDTTGLAGSTPTGRYVEFAYIPEKSNGQAMTGAKALLGSVRDVRGEVWTYDYYGQAVGETDADLLDFLVARHSPAVDTTGDGTVDAPITVESVDYTLTDGKLSQIIQTRGDGLLTTTLTFDVSGPNGEQMTTEQVAGLTTTHYFEHGVYAGAEDAAGNRATHVPDDNYRASAQQDANGNTTQLSWSGDGKHLDQVTDALGSVMQFTYNTNNTLNYSLDAQGRKTEYTYGDMNQPHQPTEVKVIDGDGTTVLRWQKFTYDAKGRTLSETVVDPSDGTTELQKVVKTYYADVSGAVGAGLLQSVTQKDLTSANDTTTIYTYDSAGRVIKTQKVSLLGPCQFSYTVYDDAGNILATVCGAADTTSPTTVAEAVAMYYANDPTKKYAHVTIHVYDALGRRISSTTDAGAVYAKTSLTLYDALDRVWRTVGNYQVQGSSAPGDWVWSEVNARWEDGANTAIDHGIENDENIISDILYNARGMVRLRRDTLGAVTLYGYDNAGRLVKTIQSAATTDYNNDYVGISPDPEMSAYTPDSITPDADIITEQMYDANGNLVQTIDALGYSTFTVYDALNRVVKTIGSAKAEATTALNAGDIGYDETNDPRSDDYVPSARPDRDLLTMTEYDAVGHVVRTSRLLDMRGGAAWDSTCFVYDALGRQVRTIAQYVPQGDPVTDPADWVWANERWEDGANHPISHGNNDQNVITETIFNVAGQVQATLDINRYQTRYVYDGLGKQIKTIANYVPQGNPVTDPTDWAWSGTNAQWEYSQGNAVDHGIHNDQNLITESTYDSDGRVWWSRDIEGKRTWNVYDGQGRLVTKIANYSEQGSSSPVDWVWSEVNARWEDGAGSPIQRYSDAANPDNFDQNVISTTVYDAQGRVQKTRDVYGNLTLYAYNAAGQRVKMVRNALASTYDVDSDPDLSEYDPAVGADADQDYIIETTEARDPAGRVIRSVDRLGIETRHVYDALGRRLRTVNNYAAQGSSDPADWAWNEATMRWEDGFGAAIGHGADNDQNLISDTAYNKAGQMLSTRDVRGTQTAFVYDAAGRRVQVIQAANNPLETLAYTCYDKAGRVLRSIQNWMDDGTAPDEQDTNGDWVFAPPTHDGGYNDRNRITIYGYNRAGRRIGVSDPVGNATLTTYRLDGQIDTVADPEGGVTLFRYDAQRRTLRVVQNYITVGEDPANWVWASTRWEDSGSTPIPHGTDNDQNVIVEVGYDLSGRKISQRDPRGPLTTYDYDQLGRRIKLTNPLTKSWMTTYTDLNGAARTMLTDPKSVDTQRDFDRLGRLVGIGYGNAANTPDVAFSYDAAGNRSAMTENDGTADVHVTHYEYDELRRLTQVGFDVDGDDTVDESVSYVYDVGGRRTQLTLAGSLAVTYEYDDVGRLIRLTDWDGHATTYAYDNANRLIAAERHNGLRSRYAFDAAGRLRSLRHSRDANTLAHFAYGVDGRGNRTQALELLAHPATTGDTTYAFDDPNIVYRGPWTDAAPLKQSTRLSAALQLTFFGADVTLTYGVGPNHSIFDVYINGGLWRSFDGYAATSGEETISLVLESDGPHELEIRNRAEHSLAAQADASYEASQYVLRFKSLLVADMSYDLRTIQYRYDGLARLLEARYNPGGAVDVADADLLRWYRYDYDLAGNRLAQTVTVNGGAPVTTNFSYNAGNQITNAGFAYDDNGNLTHDGTTTYTWDRANRLLSAGGLSYTYDGAGNRIAQDNGVDITRYLLDLQPGLVKVLAQTTNNNTTRFVHGPHGIHAQEDNAGNWTWIAQDGLGSARIVADDSLSVDSFQSYTPIGGALEPGTFGSPFKFTGEMVDANDLVYLRARYYSPGLGVFTGLDPVENLNRYQYVSSNPINTVDPSGMLAFRECLDLLQQDFALSSQEAQDRCDTGNNFHPAYILERYPFLSVGCNNLSSSGDFASRMIAVDYAITWSRASSSSDSNPLYPWMQGTNCTNFVSQALKEAHFPETWTGQRRGWWSDYPQYSSSGQSPAMSSCVPALLSLSRGTCGLPWAATPALHDFLIQDMGFLYTDIDVSPKQPITLMFSSDQLFYTVLSGDVVFFFQETPGITNHAGLIIGWGPPMREQAIPQQGWLDFGANPVPWFADNSGAGHIRPINDIGRPSPVTRIVLVNYNAAPLDRPVLDR